MQWSYYAIRIIRCNTLITPFALLDAIVLMTDHPTIGGYPKIATVILNDISKIAHLSVGKKIRFQKVSFETAEKLCDKNEKYLDKIFQSITTI